MDRPITCSVVRFQLTRNRKSQITLDFEFKQIKTKSVINKIFGLIHYFFNKVMLIKSIN